MEAHVISIPKADKRNVAKGLTRPLGDGRRRE